MAELHRELVSWLNQFKVIPNGSPAILSNSSLSDVIAVLRDGMVLCQLVHSLDPSSVDMTKWVYQKDFQKLASMYLLIYVLVY